MPNLTVSHESNYYVFWQTVMSKAASLWEHALSTERLVAFFLFYYREQYVSDLWEQ